MVNLMKCKITREELLKKKGVIKIPKQVKEYSITEESRLKLDRVLIELAASIENEREEDQNGPLLGE